jgi:hypothetical protein
MLFAMTADIVRLLPADEHDLLKYYVEGACPPDDVDAFYHTLEVPNNATPPRLAIAVAQILLHYVQGTLSQWALVRGDKVFLNRKDCMRQFRAAWDRFSADPTRLSEFLDVKRKRR